MTQLHILHNQISIILSNQHQGILVIDKIMGHTLKKAIAALRDAHTPPHSYQDTYLPPTDPLVYILLSYSAVERWKSITGRVTSSQKKDVHCKLPFTIILKTPIGISRQLCSLNRQWKTGKDARIIIECHGRTAAGRQCHRSQNYARM